MNKMNVMKQVALYAVLPMLLVACGNNEPRLEPSPNNKEVVDPKKDEPKKDEEKPKGNENDNKPSEQPAPKAELSQEEVEAYLGGLNKSWSVAKVREQIKSIGEIKNIKGKDIKITTIQLTDERPSEGTFTLQIKAEVAGQALERSYSYTGFAKRPENYYFVKNMQADWRVSKDVYTKEFALDKLYEDNDKTIFTGEYLARFVEFKTRDFSNSYTLSQEEAKALKIVDIKYRANLISFKVEYNGVKSDQELNLALDAILYYQQKVQVNATNAAKYYAEGVAEHPDLYVLQLLTYDTDRYYHEEVTAQPNSAGEELVFSFKLRSKKDERELANITKVVTGCRPLSTLAKEMVVVGNYELHQNLGRIVGNTQGGDLLLSKLNNSLPNWIKKASIKVADTDMSWSEEYRPGVGRNIILSGGTNLSNIHRYFKNPRFQVVSARREDNFIYVKFKLTSINDYGFNNLILEHESKFHLIKD